MSVGAGSKVKVHVPLPLSTATGPAAGSQPHHGPVNLTSDAPSQAVTLINNGSGYSQEPSSTFASAL